MDETKIAAYRATQEFLEQTSNVSGSNSTMQYLLNTFRQARGIIYQCGLALAPATPDASKPTVKPVGFDPSLETEHSPIFESLTTKPGWANGMLFAINTAKKMGITQFEIDTKEATDPDADRDRRRHLGMMGYVFADADDDWRSAATSCYKLTVFAVRIK